MPSPDEIARALEAFEAEFSRLAAEMERLAPTIRTMKTELEAIPSAIQQIAREWSGEAGQSALAVPDRLMSTFKALDFASEPNARDVAAATAIWRQKIRAAVEAVATSESVVAK